MKKLLTSLSLAAIVATTASADFLRVEAGAGAWEQTPSGYATRSDEDGVLKLNGTYTSDETASTEMYAWVLFKHFVPIIPNLRLEYVTIHDEGKTKGSVGGIPIVDNLNTQTSAPTTLDVDEYDVIPYYNLLDNTFWITLDLGLDVKFIQSKAKVGAVGAFTGYNSDDSSVIPLVYARGRVQVPTTGLGVEADVKAISDGTNTFYDTRAKVDYTFDIFPVIQPGIEIGYRIQKMRVDDGSTQVDLDYKGVYAGAMLRF